MRHRYTLGFIPLVLAAWMLVGCGQTTATNNRFQVGQAITYDANGNPLANSQSGGYLSDANGSLTPQQNSRVDFLVIGPQNPANQNKGPSLKSFIQAQFVSALNTNVTFELADLYYNPTSTGADKAQRTDRASHVYAAGTTAQAVDFAQKNSLASLTANSPDPTQSVFTTQANYPQSFNKAAPVLTTPEPTLTASANPISQVGNFDLTTYIYTPPNYIHSDPLHPGKLMDTFNLWIIPQDPTLAPNFITLHLSVSVGVTSPINPATITVNTPDAPTKNTLQFSASVPGDGINPAGSQVTWSAYTDSDLKQAYTDASGSSGIDTNTGVFTAPVVASTPPSSLPATQTIYIKATSKITSTIPLVNGDIGSGNTYYTSTPLTLTKASGTISFH